jgi:hypothetical protein
MVYSNEIDKFQRYYQKFETDFAKYTVLLDYLEANWMNCKSMWLQCYREKQFNLGETTNNRIESLKCHLKELGSFSDSLLQVVHFVELKSL